MATETRDQRQTATFLRDSLRDAIASVGEFRARDSLRIYLNFRHASDRFRGDQTTKFYVDDRGVLIHQPGKGTLSDGYYDDRLAVLEFCEANGITVEKRS